MSIMHNGEKVLNNLTTVPITQTINASSIETEIPSAKAVYDKINDSVLGIEITASNYSQFDSSMLNWDCGVYVIGMTSTAQLINDLPQLVAGRLYITSISKTYESESLKYRQYRYITFGGNEFIRSIEYQSGSATYDTGWRRVCTTSVVDSSGTATISNSATGTVTYEVKNGVCYVAVSALANGLTGSTVCEITGLPATSAYICIPLISGGTTVGSVWGNPNSSTIKCDKSSATAGYASFSYPVAES